MGKYTADNPNWRQYQSRRTHDAPSGAPGRIAQFCADVAASGVIACAAAAAGLRKGELADALIELAVRSKTKPAEAACPTAKTSS